MLSLKANSAVLYIGILSQFMGEVQFILHSFNLPTLLLRRTTNAWTLRGRGPTDKSAANNRSWSEPWYEPLQITWSKNGLWRQWMLSSSWLPCSDWWELLEIRKRIDQLTSELKFLDDPETMWKKYIFLFHMILKVVISLIRLMALCVTYSITGKPSK